MRFGSLLSIVGAVVIVCLPCQARRDAAGRLDSAVAPRAANARSVSGPRTRTLSQERLRALAVNAKCPNSHPDS
jgi:hypothetical protein